MVLKKKKYFMISYRVTVINLPANEDAFVKAKYF